MSAQQTPQIETMGQANDYIESARALYRQGEGEYRGRRNDEQQIIAEVTADEAREVVDGVMAGIIAVGANTELPVDYEDTEFAGYTWRDFRGEFERLLVGVGVMTNRLERDGHNIKGYADLRAEERLKVASVLFGDFMAHNSLRFGVEGSGVTATKRRAEYTEDGEVIHHVDAFDPDVAKSLRDIKHNMIERGYSTEPATHPAGKISPDEYRKLRREFPEITKDNFDRDVSFYRDVQGQLERRE